MAPSYTQNLMETNEQIAIAPRKAKIEKFEKAQTMALAVVFLLTVAHVIGAAFAQHVSLAGRVR